MVSLCQDFFGENPDRPVTSLRGYTADDGLDHPLAGKIANENPIFGRIMTDLNSLVVFAHVVEANSFSGAALSKDGLY